MSLKIITLAAWAGLDFSFAHGDLVLVPDAVATDRIAAGLARRPTAAEDAKLPLRRLPGTPEETPTRPSPPPPKR